jgi:hypothetical protein
MHDFRDRDLLIRQQADCRQANLDTAVSAELVVCRVDEAA